MQISGKNSQKYEKGKYMSVLHLWDHSCFGGGLIVTPLAQLKLINTLLCYLTDPINVPEV